MSGSPAGRAAGADRIWGSADPDDARWTPSPGDERKISPKTWALENGDTLDIHHFSTILTHAFRNGKALMGASQTIMKGHAEIKLGVDFSRFM